MVVLLCLGIWSSFEGAIHCLQVLWTYLSTSSCRCQEECSHIDYESIHSGKMPTDFMWNVTRQQHSQWTALKVLSGNPERVNAEWRQWTDPQVLHFWQHPIQLGWESRVPEIDSNDQGRESLYQTTIKKNYSATPTWSFHRGSCEPRCRITREGSA